MADDDLDRVLIAAWERAYHQYKDDAAALEHALRRFGGPTYTRPLRSWALVLRANDKRIPDDNAQGLVRIDAERVRTWCAPVRIDYPGVSLDEAARLFGVNRTTVSRWASPADQTWWQAVQSQMRGVGDDARFGRPAVYWVEGRRLLLEHEHNRSNPKRSTTRVWTPRFDGLDPGGDVWSADWGRLRLGLAERVPAGFEQMVERVDRRLVDAGRCASPATRVAARVMQWVCPSSAGGCGRQVYKLYLPMPVWTLARALRRCASGVSGEGGDGFGVGCFLCWKCSGLIYESAERTASPGRRGDGSRRRVDAWDRFIKRISGGTLPGPAVTPAPRHAGQPRTGARGSGRVRL